jgi:HEAT repeat protein
MSNENIDKIISKLNSPMEDDRQCAIVELVKLNSVNVIPVLRKVSSTDESIKIRYYAKKGLQFLKARLHNNILNDNFEVKNQSEKNILIKIRDTFRDKDVEDRISLIQSIIRYDRKDLLPEIVNLIKKEKDTFVISKLIIAIGILGNNNYIGTIEKYLKAEDFRIRANAIEALGYIGGSEILPLLLSCLEDSDNRVKANAVKELKKFGIDIITRTLDQMVSSNQVWMRDSAVNALNEICTERFLPHLIKLLNDPKDAIRSQAFKGIKKLADKEVALAKEILKRVSDCTVNGDDVVSFLNLVNTEFNQEFLKGLSDSDFKVRLETVYSILKEGRKDCTDLLIERLHIEEDNYVKAVILTVLSRIEKSPRIKNIFLAHLKDENHRIRANSVEGLIDYPDYDIKDEIFFLLKDENNRVKANAVLAMSKFSDFNPIPWLKDMLESENLLMRNSAVFVITEIANDSTINLLEKYLNDSNEEFKSKIISALKIISEGGYQKAEQILKANESKNETDNYDKDFDSKVQSIEIDKLIFDLRADNFETKINSLKILKDFGDEQCLDPLKELFKDSSESVRTLATDVFNTIKKRINFEKHAKEIGAKDFSEISSDKMLILLNDSDRDIRLSAVMQIRLGDSAILPDLKERLIFEKDHYVISALVSTLGMLGNVNEIEDISKYITHSDPRVRANAVEGMSYTASADAIQYIIMALNDNNQRTVNNARRALKLFSFPQLFEKTKQMFLSHGNEISDLIIQTASLIGGEFANEILVFLICKNDDFDKIIEFSRVLNSVWSVEKRDIDIIEKAKKYIENSDIFKTLKLEIFNCLISDSKEETINFEVFLKKYKKEDYIFDSISNIKKKSSVQKLLEEGKLQRLDITEKTKRIIKNKSDKKENLFFNKSDFEKSDTPCEEDKVSRIIKNISEELVDNDEDIRKNAVIKLSKINDSRVIELLKNVSDNDSSSVVKFFAKRYLKTFAGKGKLPSLTSSKSSVSETTKNFECDNNIIKKSNFRKYIIRIFFITVVFLLIFLYLKKDNLFIEQKKDKSFKIGDNKNLAPDHLKINITESSEKIFLDLINKIKDDPDASRKNEKIESLLRWGTVFEKSGKFEKAGNQYLECLSENENCLEINLKLIRAYKLIGKNDFLIKYYSEKKMSDINKYYLALSAETNEESLSLLKMINPSSQFPWSLFTLGINYLENEKYEISLEKFKEFIKIKNDYPDVLLVFGYSLYKAGYIDSALKAFDKLSVIRPYMYKIPHLQALIYFSKNDKNTAAQYFDLAYGKTDNDPKIFNDAAECWNILGNFKKSSEYYSKAWMIEKGSARFCTLAESVFVKSKNFIIAAEVNICKTSNCSDNLLFDNYINSSIDIKINTIFSDTLRKNKNYEIFRKSPEIEYFKLNQKGVDK